MAPFRRSSRASVLAAPLFAFALLPLVGGTASAGALPTGGKVVAGTASIGKASGGVLTVDQSSSKAIIDWSSFSIGQGKSVVIDNGSGATLNRVTGTGVSSLQGLLSGTGSVYLINSNGVIVGRRGVVDVGGTFVASTLDAPDASFLAGGPLKLAGSSLAAVVNYGKIGSLGGDVALVARRVSNVGSIGAANGSAGLLSGAEVSLSDGSLDEGRFSVLLPASGGSVRSSGVIAAADAELRAEGGNVYALAGNTAGTIRATGVAGGGGHIWLVADGGALHAASTMEAQSVGGGAGAIETSGDRVEIGFSRINAHGGSWLLDPADLTIDTSAASSISSALDAGTDVTQSTSKVGSGGHGDIFVEAPISWTTSAELTLSAYRNIAVDATISSSGGGGVILRADNSGRGIGTVNFATSGGVSTAGSTEILYNPRGNDRVSVNDYSYTSPTDYSRSVSGGGTLQSFMLVNTIYDLQNIQNDLSADYALGRNVSASATTTWNPYSSNGYAGFKPLGSESEPFSGVLLGEGRVINRLFVNNRGGEPTGLFSVVSGQVSDVIMQGANVFGGADSGLLSGSATAGAGFADDSVSGTLHGGDDTGGLVGLSQAAISRSSSDAQIFTNSATAVGGFVGSSSGSLDQVASSGILKDYTGQSVGGLVGLNSGMISDAASAEEVRAPSATGVGGLVGVNTGAIARSFASGYMGVFKSSDFGGVAGSNTGTISASYWDKDTTGLPTGIGTGDFGGTSGVSQSGADPFTQSSYAGLDFSPSSAWGIVAGTSFPYLRFQYPETPPQVISGYGLRAVYSSPRPDGPLNLLTYPVGAVIDGVRAAKGSMGADGYYQLLVPAGTIASSGTGVLVYIHGYPTADTFYDNATGSITNVNLFGHFLSLISGAGDMTSIARDLYQTMGSQSGSDFIFKVGSGPNYRLTLDKDPFGLPSNPQLVLYSSAANFNLDQIPALPGELYTVLLIMTQGGTLTQTVPIQASRLTLVGAGADFELTDPGNAIQLVAGEAGGIRLADRVPLEIGTSSTFPGLSADTVAIQDGTLVSESQPIVADRLLLEGAGDFQLVDRRNAIDFLAGNVGSLNLNDSADLSIGSVDDVSGLKAKTKALIASTGAETDIQIDADLAAQKLMRISATGKILEGARGLVIAQAFQAKAGKGIRLLRKNDIEALHDVQNTGAGNIGINSRSKINIVGLVKASAAKAQIALQSSSDLIIGKAGVLDAGAVSLRSGGRATESMTGQIDAGTLNVTAVTGIALIGNNDIGAIGTDETTSGPDRIKR